MELTALDQVERTHYQAIQEKEVEVAELEQEYEGLKADASAAKKRFEAADKELRYLIRKGPDRQTKLRLADSDAPAAEVAEWKGLPLAALDLAEGIQTKLVEAGIATLGDLQAKVEQHGECWYQDIAGIGQGKAEDIADAFMVFWGAHPEYCRGGEQETNARSTTARREPIDGDPLRIRLTCDLGGDDPVFAAGTDHDVVEWGESYVAIEQRQPGQAAIRFELDAEDYDVLEYHWEGSEDDDESNELDDEEIEEDIEE